MAALSAAASENELGQHARIGSNTSTMAEGPAAQQIPTSQSPGAAAQALQSLQDRPAEPPVTEAARPNSKTLVDVEGVTYKRCTHCKELKIRDQNFNKDKSRGDGFACTCKSCANRHTRAWHERHKQQASLYSVMQLLLSCKVPCRLLSPSIQILSPLKLLYDHIQSSFNQDNAPAECNQFGTRRWSATVSSTV